MKPVAFQNLPRCPPVPIAFERAPVTCPSDGLRALQLAQLESELWKMASRLDDTAADEGGTLAEVRKNYLKSQDSKSVRPTIPGWTSPRERIYQDWFAMTLYLYFCLSSHLLVNATGA